MLACLGRFPTIHPFRVFLSSPVSFVNAHDFKSSLIHSFQLLTPLPLPLASVTNTFYEQIPIHPFLHICNTNNTHLLIPIITKYFLFQTRMHLTINLSTLSNLYVSSDLIGQVLLSYIITLCTQAVYVSPYTFREVYLDVSTGQVLELCPSTLYFRSGCL